MRRRAGRAVDRILRALRLRRPPRDLVPWPGDEGIGGAGVREPRRPRPAAGSGAVALEPPPEQTAEGP